MTVEDSIKFIETVLGYPNGYWPKWEFNETQIEAWVNRLRRYDYGAAKRCIDDYAFARTKQGIPPAGALLAILHKAFVPKDRDESGPMPLYQIMRPGGRPRGFLTASAKRVTDADAVVAEAQALVQLLDRNGSRGLYIQYLCNDLFKEPQEGIG